MVFEKCCFQALKTNKNNKTMNTISNNNKDFKIEIIPKATREEYKKTKQKYFYSFDILFC